MVRLLQIAPRFDELKCSYMQDEYLPYRHKPNLAISNYTSTGEFNIAIRHNSAGFRDREHSFAKPKDTYRILGLGDSFTYGEGNNFEETYLYLLENMLNGRIGKPVEIIKAGQCRYFPGLERRLLENYGIKYSPDLILIQFSPNDVIDTSSGIGVIIADKSGYLISADAKDINPIVKFLYIKSHFCRYLIRKYFDYIFSLKFPMKKEQIYQDNGFYEKDWKGIENEYEKIIEIADKINAGVVLIHLPYPPPWGRANFYPAKRLAKFAAQHKIGFVDILPAMIKNKDKAMLYYPKDGHCTPAGNKLIADEIYKYLINENL